MYYNSPEGIVIKQNNSWNRIKTTVSWLKKNIIFIIIISPGDTNNR